MNAQRDISFSICKAFAIIFVVLSHAGGPAWLSSFVFQFHVPVFYLPSQALAQPLFSLCALESVLLDYPQRTVLYRLAQ